VHLHAAPLLLAALGLAGACAPPPPPPVAPGPTVDEALVQRVVDAALHMLTRRSYSVAGCVAAGVQVVGEAEVRGAPAPAAGGCSLRVARQRDRTWLVVVRSASQPGTPRALVTVSPGGEGAQHIDYDD
jgi:hypothetical protein